jgi:hypothetical protein
LLSKYIPPHLQKLPKKISSPKIKGQYLAQINKKILLLNRSIEKEFPPYKYHNILQKNMPKKQVFSGYPLKGKTNKKLTFEDRFEGVNSTPLITEYKQRIQRSTISFFMQECNSSTKFSSVSTFIEER